MVRNAAAFVNRNLGRGDLDSLINLNRIAVNDLAAQRERDFNSECALARRSWSDDGDDVSIIHPRAMISRIAITSQMTNSNTIAPMIWLREKRMTACLSQHEEAEKQSDNPCDYIDNTKHLGGHCKALLVVSHIVNLN